MEKLVTYYPKKEYWVDLLSRMQRKPSFSDRLALDAYPAVARHRQHDERQPTSWRWPSSPSQADLPSEGKQVGRQGLRRRRAGHRCRGRARTSACAISSPSGSPRTPRSRGQDETSALAAKSGDALVAVGMNMVYSGQAAKGVQLMQQGIAKGGLKRAEDAKLHLGIAQLIAGDKAKAQATFKTVQGADGTADLARLWMLHARRNA